MYDFVKIRNPKPLCADLRDNKNIVWITDTNNLKSEDVKTFPYYSDMKFDFRPTDYTELSGSLHKTYNEVINQMKPENWNRFTFSNFIDYCSFMTEMFGFNPYKVTVHSFEFGVNIAPQIKSKTILDGIVSYKHKPQKDSLHYGHFKRFKLSNYLIKVYDKGSQYSRPNQILRIELHIDKMQRVDKYEIKTLADLLNPRKAFKLKRELLDAVENLQFDLEPILSVPGLSNTERRQITRLIKINCPKTLISAEKQKYYRLNRKIKSILKKLPELDMRSQIKEQIEAEWQLITKFDSEVKSQLRDYLSHFPEYKKVKQSYRIVEG